MQTKVASQTDRRHTPTVPPAPHSKRGYQEECEIPDACSKPRVKPCDTLMSFREDCVRKLGARSSVASQP